MTELLGRRKVLGSAILVALSSGTGCSGSVVDIGQNEKAPAGPVYAVSAPPTSDEGGASKLVDKEWNIVSMVAEGGRVFWASDYAWADMVRGPPQLAMAIHNCSAEHCKDSHKALDLYAEDRFAWSNTDLSNLSMVINDTDVFWLDPTLSIAAGYCLRDDCSAKNQLNLALDGKFTFGVDDTYFYFASKRAVLVDAPPPSVPPEVTVARCELADCATTTSRFSMTAPPGEVAYDGASQVVLDGDYLYLLSGTRIIRVRKDGLGSFEVIARDQQNVGAIAVRGESIFWTESVLLGRIQTCPVSGCVGEPRVVASNLQTPNHLALDDEFVYFTYPFDADVTRGVSSNSDRLLRCPIAGCAAPTVLAENQLIGGPVVTDDQFVYFTGNECAMSNGQDYFTEACSYLAAVGK